MENIDFTELEMNIPVGRPASEVALDVIDLKPVLVDMQFERRLNHFFNHWGDIVKAKSKDEFREKTEDGVTFTINKYRSNMEAFYGELIEKFCLLPTNQKNAILAGYKPIRSLYKLTNLSVPNVFPNLEDNEYFVEELKNAQL